MQETMSIGFSRPISMTKYVLVSVNFFCKIMQTSLTLTVIRPISDHSIKQNLLHHCVILYSVGFRKWFLSLRWTTLSDIWDYFCDNF